MKEGNLQISLFRKEDLQDTLEYLCTYQLQYVYLIPVAFQDSFCILIRGIQEAYICHELYLTI